MNIKLNQKETNPKMRMIKDANGKIKIKMSKKEWQQIGKSAGWSKFNKTSEISERMNPKSNVLRNVLLALTVTTMPFIAMYGLERDFEMEELQDYKRLEQRVEVIVGKTGKLSELEEQDLYEYENHPITKEKLKTVNQGETIHLDDVSTKSVDDVSTTPEENYYIDDSKIDNKTIRM